MLFYLSISLENPLPPYMLWTPFKVIEQFQLDITYKLALSSIATIASKISTAPLHSVYAANLDTNHINHNTTGV